MRHTVGRPLGAQAGPTLDTADVEWLSMGTEPGGGPDHVGRVRRSIGCTGRFC